MAFALIALLLVIIWIVVGTSSLKWHPFIILLSAAFALSFLIGLPLNEIARVIGGGFGKIIQNIGLLIVFGTVIGAALEQSGGATAIANGMLRHLNKLPLPYVISCIGYLVSIPVFCDAAFVILSNINKVLSKKTKTPLVGMTVALSTGLFAPHVLVPPTPGPLAAAANLSLDNLFLLILTGGIIALILILAGGAYAVYLSKKYPYAHSHDVENQGGIKVDDREQPSFTRALAPILIPILLMCLGTLFSNSPLSKTVLSWIAFIAQPSHALLIGLLLCLRLVKRNKKTFFNQSVNKGIQQAAPILIITGMGGALGAVIQQIPIDSFAQSVAALESLGILIPFLIAALLKTAQGSSTVAIITTSSIIFPLLPALGLESEMGKVWAIMALGVGAMTVSHANDSYFWIVSQMSGMDVKTAYRTHTMGTLIQGLVGLAVVAAAYSIWKLI